MEKLSQREIADLKECFAMFDKDGDGTIDTGELGTVMANLGLKVSPLEIQEMIEQVDTDKNGTIEFDEFCNLMASKLSGTDPNEECHNVFNVIDKDQDGFISLEDLRATAGGLQWGSDRPPTEEDLALMLSMFTDRGAVDLETFKSIVGV